MKIHITILLIFLITSCANMVAPTGGDKDIKGPKILNITMHEDIGATNNKTITFEFDEYIQLNNWEEFFYISPPIKKRIKKKTKGKFLLITIQEALNENTTYYISLNSCIKDYNEGNILDTLSYQFSTYDSLDTLTLSGNLLDSYSLSIIENAWIMLFNYDKNDTLIFKDHPNYIAKTDKNGVFHFPNLKSDDFKIVALTDFNFIYDEGEKIAFLEDIVNAKTDSFISLSAFNPIIQIDSTITDSISLKSDRSAIKEDLNLMNKKEKLINGKLEISINKSFACFFQLLQNDKVILQKHFTQKPYIIDQIIPGKYQLKYIADKNRDSIWNTGNWEKRIQPEEVAIYNSEITIRSNWDLEIEWIIKE